MAVRNDITDIDAQIKIWDMFNICKCGHALVEHYDKYSENENPIIVDIRTTCQECLTCTEYIRADALDYCQWIAERH